MATPLIVITVEGGIIQDISVSHQARVVFVDRIDWQDYQPEYVRTLEGKPAAVVDNELICPEESRADWLKDVLLCLPR